MLRLRQRQHVRRLRAIKLHQHPIGTRGPARHRGRATRPIAPPDNQAGVCVCVGVRFSRQRSASILGLCNAPPTHPHCQPQCNQQQLRRTEIKLHAVNDEGDRHIPSRELSPQTTASRKPVYQDLTVESEAEERRMPVLFVALSFCIVHVGSANGK